MLKIVLYSHADCPRCAQLREELLAMRAEFGFTFEEVNMEGEETLEAQWGPYLPAVVINGWLRLKEVRDPAALRRALEKIKAHQEEQKPLTGHTRELVLTLDRGIYWLSKHWLFLFNLALGIYAGLPVLAPLLAWQGFNSLAGTIYFIYSYFCHQQPSRSFFILGYQMAYCQRDTAIYTAMLVAGLIFALVGRKVGPLPPKLMLLGLVLVSAPMVVDGGMQLFMLRQSNWWLRTITGALFGAGSVWLTYPYLEQGMREVRETLESKGLPH